LAKYFCQPLNLLLKNLVGKHAHIMFLGAKNIGLPPQGREWKLHRRAFSIMSPSMLAKSRQAMIDVALPELW
jgi:hypothetical protein